MVRCIMLRLYALGRRSSLWSNSEGDSYSQHLVSSKNLQEVEKVGIHRVLTEENTPSIF